MKRYISLFLTAALMFVLSACGTAGSGEDDSSQALEPSGNSQTSQETDETEKEPIVIGNIQDLSSSSSVWGKSYQWGAEYAAKLINEAGGVDGRMIEVITYDSKNDVNEGINAYNRLCQQDNAVAVFGLASNIGIAIAPLSETNKVPLVSDFMDERATTKEDGTPYTYMFLTEPSCNQQGMMMAGYGIEKLGKTKAAVLYDQSNSYAAAHVEPFVEYFEQNGGTVVANEPFNSTDKDYRAQLTKIKAAEPDVLYISGYAQQNALAYQQARQMGLDCVILGNNSFTVPFADLVNGDVENVYFPNNVNYEEEAIKEIVDKFKEENGTDPSYHVFFGYDNVMITVDAIKRAGSTDGEALAKALEETKDLECLTGKITIDPATHRPKGLDMWITEVKGKEYLPVERFVPQEG